MPGYKRITIGSGRQVDYDQALAKMHSGVRRTQLWGRRVLDLLRDREEGLASEDLADQVLARLDWGMMDEWDIGLADGLREGFGGTELQVAARAGLLAERADRTPIESTARETDMEGDA